MNIKATFSDHAITRSLERFGLDYSELLSIIDVGRFVRLKGLGIAGDGQRVRSGHLIYLAAKDEYCVVIIDDRKRHAITVLTEEMARKSSWSLGLNDAVKLRAKSIALGEEVVSDSSLLRLYAEERGPLSLILSMHTFKYNWKTSFVRLCKVEIEADQINTDNKTCALTATQMQLANQWVTKKIEDSEVQPYFDLYVGTNNKKVLVQNRITGTRGYDEGALAKRWSGGMAE